MDLQRDTAGNIWEVDPTGAAPPRFVSAPTASPATPRVLVGADPVRARREARAEEAADRSASASERAADAAGRSAGAAERTASNQDYGNAFQLRAAYDALPPVKEYRVSISQLATGLKTAANATGDNALIYAYAKTMDPASVVRESEMGMAASGQSVIESAAANYKKQFGIDGGGQLSPTVRDRLRREMLNKTTEMNRVYNSQRQRFIQDAKAFGFDPKRIVGDHDGDAFRPALKEYGQRKEAQAISSDIDKMVRAGRPYDEANAAIVKKGGTPLDPGEYDAALAHYKENPSAKNSYGAATTGEQPGYEESIVGQGVSGAYEGLADLAGFPVDLVTGAANLGTRGINALTNSNIPRIDNPTLGSDWIKDKLGSSLVYAPGGGTAGKFARRVGQSAGASIGPAGIAPNLARAAGQLAIGTVGGIGGATAQQAFPGNPIAEVAGEVLAGGATGAGMLGVARRNATRAVEAAVPTSNELREQAGQLYRQAENRGVVADGQDTATLANTLRTALTEEGLISPTGRLSDVYQKARQALLLADDYAGGPMNPSQMQTVRKQAADGLSSPEPAERRLGGIITKAVDDWAAPMAPELSDARGVARRYLEAGELETARDAAAVRAGQYSGSGFENALRTDYRALDRAQVKGQSHFSPAVADAIATVNRGTPLSNFARGIGKLAPTGVVSGMGSVLPAMGAMSATGSPLIGGMTGMGLAALGTAGRGVATNMGLRAADVAELTARNGGALPQVNVMTPEMMQALNAIVAAESAKYLQPVGNHGAEEQERRRYPDPLAGRKGQRYFPSAPLRR